MTRFLGREAPGHDDDTGMVFSRQDFTEDLCRESFPAFSRMRACFVSADGQTRVEP